MNIQDAYKKLDLAKGLNRERVESQYQNLKAELEPKIPAAMDLQSSFAALSLDELIKTQM
jgi:hypothetical protein